MMMTTTELETVLCELCGNPTDMTGTKRCNRCWELEHRIKSDPEITRRILERYQDRSVQITLSGEEYAALRNALECAETQLALTATAIRAINSDAWNDIAGGCEKQASVVRLALGYRPADGTVLEEDDDHKKTFLSYETTDKRYGTSLAAPSRQDQVLELNERLQRAASEATAGNCNQSVEDVGYGIVLTTTW